MSEEQTRLRSLVKDQKDSQALHKGRWWRWIQGWGPWYGRPWGQGEPPGGRGASPAGSKRSVSGSSQLIASSVSSGPVSNVGRRGMFSQNVPKSPRANVNVPPPVVGILAVPLALQARGDFTFNHTLKVSEIELLEKLEGGGW